MYKSDTFKGESTLDIQTHYKETKTFEYVNFHPCQAKGNISWEEKHNASYKNTPHAVRLIEIHSVSKYA